LSPAIVSLQNLSRHYRIGDETVKAVDSVNLAIESGEFIAIVGPSGSGKSTLLHLIGGLDSPTRGSVFADSLDLSSLSEKEKAGYRNEKVGFVFQDFNLQEHLTARENVELPLKIRGTPPRIRRAKSDSLLEAVNLLHRAKHKPTQLSGGEKQRVAIARARAGDPKIILADEPTGNLDSRTGEEVVALLSKVCRERGVTVIVATHDVNIANLADRVIHIRDGRIEEVRD
jgi:putative ABC transport system ATP-binding protein